MGSSRFTRTVRLLFVGVSSVLEMEGGVSLGRLSGGKEVGGNIFACWMFVGEGGVRIGRISGGLVKNIFWFEGREVNAFDEADIRTIEG